MKNWVGKQWKSGKPDPYPPWNALDILDWIRSGRTGGFCDQYAMVFLQACLSLGIQAKYIKVGTTSNQNSHFTTEAWVSEIRKWAVMDATASNHLASHYLMEGVPQNALELHSALLSGEADRVEVLHDVDVITNGEERTFGTALENYYYFRIFFRQNQGVRPPRFIGPNNTADRYIDAVEWENAEMVQWDVSTMESSFPHERLTEHRTSDPKDLY